MRISVVIPSHQRREQAVACVESLVRQDFAGAFEVLVVVDGSTDGTAAALRALAVPFPLTVLEQPNRGSAAARSAGGHAARGEILLFLDDDMEAHPALLAEHDRSHGDGAAVVVGSIPVHPDSPRGLLTTWVARWVDGRAERLSAPGAQVKVSDLVGGQLSVSRRAFLEVGGFDTRLARGQDVDFGYRLMKCGCQAVFNANAISWQRYTVGPRQYLRQWRASGRSNVMAARKHPELAARYAKSALNRRRYRWLGSVPPLAASLRWIAIALVERGRQGPLAERLFFAAQAVEYCRGVREAGGLPRPRPLRVLAYHAISDTAGTGRFEPYGVRPQDFRQQIDTLRRLRYQFVTADEAVRFVRDQGGLPPRPVLLTFDDCYASVVEHALPVLEADAIPAVGFAVSRHVSGTNAWDHSLGAPQLPLLDEQGLRRLATAGVEIGAHSRTHRPLGRVDARELEDEVHGSRTDLESIDIGPVRLFCYPYGECDEDAARAVARAGYAAAFTVTPGLARPGVDPYRIPRVEILRGDVGWRFRWKVAVAGSLLHPDRGRLAAIATSWQRRSGTVLVDVARRVLPKPIRSWLRRRWPRPRAVPVALR